MPQLVHDYARLINQAIVEVYGATDAGIRQALYEVLHEFFQETNAWQECISVAITAGTTTYTLLPIEGGEFVRLMALLDSNQSGIAAVTDMVGTITLRDTPANSATYTATIAKTIGIPVDRDGKPEIPDWTISRFYPIVMSGLLSHLYMQPKKPYTNPTLGSYHGKKFMNGLGKVKSAVIHGNLQGAQTWRFPSAWQNSASSQRFGSGGTDQSFGVV